MKLSNAKGKLVVITGGCRWRTYCNGQST